MTSNVRGLNKTYKRRLIFRWLHQQSLMLSFFKKCIPRRKYQTWENEWGGNIFSSHGSTHSRGVMILLKPKINVKVENSITDKNGRFILVEAVFDETKYIFLNVYGPNKQARQIHFLRDLSTIMQMKISSLVATLIALCVTLTSAEDAPPHTKKVLSRKYQHSAKYT